MIMGAIFFDEIMTINFIIGSLLVLISIFIVMILTSMQIISRVVGYPWPAFLELSELAISIFAFLGVAYAQRLDAHIRMELLVGNLKGNFILPLMLELKDSDNSFKTELSIDGTFRIDNIQSGSYQLLAYQDRNNNKILDTGTFNNEKLSEKFYVYPDSLSLRSNWELEIQNWVIN